MLVTDLKDFFITPFVEFDFMRRAFIASVALSLSAPLMGVFMSLRRMSLTGDAMAHALLPGVAVASLFFGGSVLSLWIGGMTAGLCVAVLAGYVHRITTLGEETALGAFYLIALALGVLLLSLYPASIDLMHILFGSVLAIDSLSLNILLFASTGTLALLGFFYRGIVLECCDPLYFRRMSGWSPLAHWLLIILIVINLVSGFQAMGTLMTVGIMILPAAAARLFANRLERLLLLSVLFALTGTTVGLCLSFALDVSSGPCMILMLGLFYSAGLIFNVLPFKGRTRSLA